MPTQTQPSAKDRELLQDIQHQIEALEAFLSKVAAPGAGCICGKWPSRPNDAAPCARHAGTRASIQTAIKALEIAKQSLLSQ